MMHGVSVRSFTSAYIKKKKYQVLALTCSRIYDFWMYYIDYILLLPLMYSSINASPRVWKFVFSVYSFVFIIYWLSWFIDSMKLVHMSSHLCDITYRLTVEDLSFLKNLNVLYSSLDLLFGGIDYIFSAYVFNLATNGSDEITSYLS